MSNEEKGLKIFENEEFGELTVITGDDGKAWFVGKEITNILGYKKGRNAILAHVDAEDKDALQQGTLGGNQQMTIINKSGVFSLVLSSKLPNAKKFKHWITSDVLPSIEETGKYEVVPNKPVTFDLNFIHATLKQLESQLLEIEEHKKVIELQEGEIKILEPKAKFTDEINISKWL